MDPAVDQMTLDGNNFDQIINKKIYKFESVLVLSIFCPKNSDL